MFALCWLVVVFAGALTIAFGELFIKVVCWFGIRVIVVLFWIVLVNEFAVCFGFWVGQ